MHLYYGELAMRHQLRPSIDGLENKTLLSHLAVGLIAHNTVHQAEVQLAVPAQPAMTVSLTTNQLTYNPGDVVKMSLTMTNTSKKDETVELGPSTDGFFITQNGNVIWKSNDGVEPSFIVKEILKPGQSITLTADWTVPASATGTFVVHDQLFPSGPSAAFVVHNQLFSSGP
jgi:hypothetical protein